MNKCQARQQSDQKRCERCNLLWDMNDLDPPECKTPHDIAMDAMRKQLNNNQTVDGFIFPTRT